MRFEAVCGSLIDQECDTLIVNLFQDVKQPGGATGAVDKALGGLIAKTIEEEDFRGRLGDTLVLRTCGKIPASKVVVVGLGKKEDLDSLSVMRAAGAAARECMKLRARTVASVLHGAGSGGFSPAESAKCVTLGTILGTYEFNRLKTEDTKPNPIEVLRIVEISSEKLSDIRSGISRGEVIGHAICFARDLANEPSNVVTPSYLAEMAQQIARENDLECTVLDRRGIEEAGMGLLTAVARGAAREPYFIELRYVPPNSNGSTNIKKIALVGKGITFDSGGYSLKSHSAMSGMKDDMSGAAAVLAAMRALAKLKPPVVLVGIVPATENAIGSQAIHPGDVFKSLSGKTVEVTNTDAEGRLILADAVAWAVKQGVDEIIDCATLTGACVTALGDEISGVFANRQTLADKLIAAGESCGEKLWQLPLHTGYRKRLKSEVADLKNTAGHAGGAIIGALFIESFVGETPWAHIDLSAASADKENELTRKGATGVPTGTLIEYVMGLQTPNW
ncbi:MAG: leucyl aminopeptidase [Armatimonadota bacterium]|nr:leucyl aminopeptidase [Armatimonadota bacterium]